MDMAPAIAMIPGTALAVSIRDIARLNPPIISIRLVMLTMDCCHLSAGIADRIAMDVAISINAAPMAMNDTAAR